MSPAAESTHEWSKVPRVTLAFWVVKILATTVGETGGDALSMTLKLGYAESTLIFLAFFIGTLTAQVSSTVGGAAPRGRRGGPPVRPSTGEVLPPDGVLRAVTWYRRAFSEMLVPCAPMPSWGRSRFQGWDGA